MHKFNRVMNLAPGLEMNITVFICMHAINPKNIWLPHFYTPGFQPNLVIQCKYMVNLISLVFLYPHLYDCKLKSCQCQCHWMATGLREQNWCCGLRETLHTKEGGYHLLQACLAVTLHEKYKMAELRFQLRKHELVPFPYLLVNLRW